MRQLINIVTGVHVEQQLQGRWPGWPRGGPLAAPPLSRWTMNIILGHQLVPARRSDEEESVKRQGTGGNGSIDTNTRGCPTITLASSHAIKICNLKW